MDSKGAEPDGPEGKGSRANPCRAGSTGDSDTGYNGDQQSGPVTELAYVADLKSAEGKPSCGFESHRAHFP